MGTRHRTHLIATIVLVTSFCSILAGSEAKELGVKIEQNVPVPMRDGAILRADVHRPDRGGPYPVLVQRTPYGRSGYFSDYVKAGYIVVSQDARGRGESEGKWESLYRFQTHDSDDGYDTVEWAAKLPGSNGKAGTFGTSYPAFLQWRLAPLRPPSLVCMSACSIPAQIWDGERPCTIRPGFRLNWLITMASEMRRKANLPGVHTASEAQILWREESQKWLYWLPWLELPDDFFSYETDSLKSWLENPHSDPWRLHKRIKDISVPNLDMVGWYDHAHGDMLLFQTMVQEARTEVARKGSRIIIGPWGHGSTWPQRGPIEFGSEAGLNGRAHQIRWFDYWLKDKQNGVDKDAPVRIFVMGDNKWRDEEYWPLRRAKVKIFFIASDGHANTPSGDGKLADKKPRSSDTDSYVYDPKNPVPTPYGMGRLRPVDQRPLANRKDIVVYQTEPLTKRIEVTGYPIVELYASSSAPDTDWLVLLIDVHPDGLALDVSHRMVRARYRDGFDKPKLIQPGEVVKYIINMRPTSNAFLPGHRIRLDITSSDFPNYDRHHNTAANQNADAALITAKQTIYHGGEHATRIILPWVPNPIVKEKTTEKEKPEPKLKKQMYPFHQAAAHGDVDQVKLLISNGADVNAKAEKEMTPLHYAAKAGKMEMVQLLIKAGADVNAKDQNGLTPLVKTASRNIAELLIAKGTDIDAGEGYWTALHNAVRFRHRDTTELLIQNGANVNAKNNDGKTPVHYAVLLGSTEVIRMLLVAGADIDSISLNIRSLILTGDVRVVNPLIAKSGDVDAKDESGCTMLHFADDTSVVELLLDKGANIDIKDNEYSFTPLHYAARFGREDVADVLIARGANINAKDKWDFQPIHWAAYHDRADVIELLLSKGADINAKTSLGQTPLQLAQERRNTKTIEVLHKHSGSVAVKTESKALKVLFIGNSYTGGIRDTLNNLIGASPYSESTLEYAVKGGWTLKQHLNDENTKSKIKSAKSTVIHRLCR